MASDLLSIKDAVILAAPKDSITYYAPNMLNLQKITDVQVANLIKYLASMGFVGTALPILAGSTTITVVPK